MEKTHLCALQHDVHSIFPAIAKKADSVQKAEKRSQIDINHLAASSLMRVVQLLGFVGNPQESYAQLRMF